jgi:hypothetical protein
MHLYPADPKFRRPMNRAGVSSGRLGRGIWGAALLVRLLASCTTTDGCGKCVQPLDGDVVTYGKWSVGCSNLGSCSAIAPTSAGDGGAQPTHIRMNATRAAATPQIEFVREGDVLERLPADTTERLVADLVAEGRPDTITLSIAGSAHAVPRDGFASVLGAIAAWRAMPSQGVVATDPVTALPAVPVTGIMPPLRVAAAPRRCPVAAMGQSLEAWRGIGGQTLWKVGCGDEGLNAASFWYVAGPQGAPATEVVFEDSDGPLTLLNASFDPASGYLRSTHYFGGHLTLGPKDCGVYRVYAWAAEGMKLIEKRVLPTCGMDIWPEDWILVFRAPLLDGPDSGP